MFVKKFGFLVFFIVIFNVNVFGYNEELKNMTKNVFIEYYPEYKISLYEFIEKNDFSWWWNFFTNREGRKKFINNPSFNTLFEISKFEFRDYSYYSDSIKTIRLKDIMGNNTIKINNILEQGYIFSEDYVSDDFYYNIDKGFIDFMKIENLQKVLTNHNIYEDILNYSILMSDYPIIWIQTNFNNYYMVYEIGSYNKFVSNEENVKNYKFYTQEEIKNRFMESYAEIFIDGKKIEGSKAIIQDKELDDTILIPVRSVLESIFAKDIVYSAQDNKIGFKFKEEPYTIYLTEGVIYKKDIFDINVQNSDIIGCLKNSTSYELINNRFYISYDSFDFIEKFGYRLNINRENNIIDILSFNN